MAMKGLAMKGLNIFLKKEEDMKKNAGSVCGKMRQPRTVDELRQLP